MTRYRDPVRVPPANGPEPFTPPVDPGEIDAIVFDLDDTLIDWWGSWQRCAASFAPPEVIAALADHVRSACWQRHPDHEDLVWHRNTWQIHEHRHDLWPEALPWLDRAQVADLVDRFAQDLDVGFFPEVIEVLEHLRTRTRLAVLSNNLHLPHEAERLELSQWFEACLVAHPEAKPRPEAFLQACERLGVTPSRTVYVGDSIRADALGALGAGLIPIWVDRFDDRWEERPRAVGRIAALDELGSWFDPSRAGRTH